MREENRTGSEPAGEEDTMTLEALSRESGIPEATLQLWQGRYGVPSPVDQTTPSRYAASQLIVLNQIRGHLDAGTVEAEAVSQVCGPHP